MAHKGNLLTHHRVHPHHEPEGAAVVVKVVMVRQKFDAHRREFQIASQKIKTNIIAPLLRSGQSVGVAV
jgi:hypothetical protein